MKIVHVATIDVGGAYRAAVRLHEGLLAKGVISTLLLRTKTRENGKGQTVFSNSLKALVSKAKNGVNLLCKDGEIARDLLGTDISRNSYIQEADLIILHWVNSFLTEREIEKLAKLNKPIVWFIHDMWLMTGGCHVDRGCGRYQTGCGQCPFVKHKGVTDLSARNFMRKQQMMRTVRPFVAGPSHWIVNEASKSLITQKSRKITYLPNMIDTSVFSPVSAEERMILKKKLGLPLDRKAILFGAADTGTENENKGFRYLLEALQKLDQEKYALAVFGNARENLGLPAGFLTRQYGFISEESLLADLYRACDVFVNPSNQESFGFTTCEAMACGTPCVSFPVGGLLDQITHRENGYLACYHDASDLACGIQYCAEEQEVLREKAAKAAARFDTEQVIERYLAYFEEICKETER